MINNALKNGQDFHEGLKYPSPAVKIAVLGWYDGPTDGYLESQDGKVFRFKMLDAIQNWGKEGNDLRLYELFPLPADSLERFCRALAPYQSPRWPVWAPLWTFPSATDQQVVDRTVKEIDESAGPRQWLVASADLSTEIVAAILEPSAMEQVGLLKA